jgi:ATP-dependent helicase HrpA
VDDSIERNDIVSWDFDTLDEQLVLERHGMTMTLYPALQDAQKSVAIKLYDQQSLARINHAQGIYRLMSLQLNKELNGLKKQLPDIDRACLLYTPYGSCADLKQDMVMAILLNSLRDSLSTRHSISSDGMVKELHQIRTAQQFSVLMAHVKERLRDNTVEISQTVLTLLQANQLLAKQLKSNIPFNLVNTLADIKSQQMSLIYKGFIAQTPLVWLKRIPRYCKGMMARLEKAKSDHRRDGLNQSQITPLWEHYSHKINALKNEKNTPDVLYFAYESLLEYRWLIEELRISLFAQELKTSQPVSVKRLEKKWQQLNSN